MKHHPSVLKTVLLALATGLALTACDRREDMQTPTAATEPPSDVMGTMPTDTATTTGGSPGSATTTPDATINQSPTGAGSVYSPGSNTGSGNLGDSTNMGGTSGSTGTTTDSQRGDSVNMTTPGNPTNTGGATNGQTGTSTSGTGSR